MKSNNEIITAIQTTLKKAGEELTETQSALLSGCLFIWLDKVREGQHQKTAKAAAEIVENKVEFGQNYVCRLISKEHTIEDIKKMELPK